VRLTRLNQQLLRSIPDRREADPLDFRYAGVAADNRWNARGVPAGYFSATWTACASEYARHLEDSPFGSARRKDRAVFCVRIRLTYVLDLTDDRVLAELGIAGMAPDLFLDAAQTRALAARLLKEHPQLQAIRVPSVALLDRPIHWNLVVFLDRIDVARALQNRGRRGTLTVKQSPGDDEPHVAALARIHRSTADMTA